MRKNWIKALFLVLIVMMVTLSNTTTKAAVSNVYLQRFMELYKTIHSHRELQTLSNYPTPQLRGYFNGNSVPYHAFESFLVEAPDFGHETTSETFSYYIWLEAMYGKVTQEWMPLYSAWASMENYCIPGMDDQPTTGTIQLGRYSAQSTTVEDYPVLMYNGRTEIRSNSGEDPLAAELKSIYGTDYIYGMHWLLDTDNFYGFGHKGNESDMYNPVFIQTCERGGAESAWSTIPHPCWKNNKYGGTKTLTSTGATRTNGFGDIFLNNPYGWRPEYAKEYSYSVATDADARAIQAIHMAVKAAKEQGRYSSTVSNIAKKAAKMGDYLRYGMNDKYFCNIGLQISETLTPDNDNSDVGHLITIDNPGSSTSCHYLLGWNYAWGAGIPGSNPWRIGDSNIHAGYQNVVAAYALAKNPEIKPSVNGRNDWETSLDRQIEFIRWLQSKEGAIGGGATNSWEGHYGTPPPGTSTFHGLSYQESPVYIGRDPITGAPNPYGNSNAWFGWQVWQMQRMAELYYELDNSEVVRRDKIEMILDRWVPWVMSQVRIHDPSYTDVIVFPANLTWTGQPTTWNATDGFDKSQAITYNSAYQVVVNDYYPDPGLAGSLSRVLTYYAMGKKSHYSPGSPEYAKFEPARDMAKEILDELYSHYRDERGYANEYSDAGFVKNFFEAKVSIPHSIASGYDGKNGKRIQRIGDLPANMGNHRANSLRIDPITGRPEVTKLTSLDTNVNGAFDLLDRTYMTFDQIRAKYEDNPGPGGADDLTYDKLKAAYQDPRGIQPVKIKYHRFFSQVDIAMAFAEFGLFFGNEVTPGQEVTFGPLTIDKINAADYGVYGTHHCDFHDRARLYASQDGKTFGRIGAGPNGGSGDEMIIGYAARVGDVICGKNNLTLRDASVENIWAAGTISGRDSKGFVFENLNRTNPTLDLGYIQLSLDLTKCKTNMYYNPSVPNDQTQWFSPMVCGKFTVNSRATAKLAGGVYYCNEFTTEPDAKLEFDTSRYPVIIIAKDKIDLKSRTKMIGDASRILLISGAADTVYIGPQTDWNGTIIAPNTFYLNVDIGGYHTDGAFIGKRVVIHQNTPIYHVPFQYDLLTNTVPGL